VVTGLGVASPLGLTVEAFWSGLVAGVSGLNRIARFDPAGFPAQIGGEVPQYALGDFIPRAYRKNFKVMSRDIELAIIAAHGALADAGLGTRASGIATGPPPERAGSCIGAGLIDADLDELAEAFEGARAHDRLDLACWGRTGMERLSPVWLLKYLPNMLACHVSILHALEGPSNTITCAEASSHLAVGEASHVIARGDAELMVAGGAEGRINPMGHLRQHLWRRLTTTRNDSPAEALRPFDTDADGTVNAEGGALLVLEDATSARARGARVYAEVVGFAATQDPSALDAPDPLGRAYEQAVRLALARAAVTPDELDLVVPHGLGLPACDRAELAGLERALDGRLERIPVATIKARTGTPGAGCGLDLVATALALHRGEIPPAPNTRRVVDGHRLDVAVHARRAPLRTALVCAYNQAGQHAALVFRTAGA